MNCFHAKFTEMSYSLNFKSDVNVILLILKIHSVIGLYHCLGFLG